MSRPLIIIITVVILVALFVFQRSGTGRVGLVFGPICAVWFAVIGGAGPACHPHSTRVCWLP